MIIKRAQFDNLTGRLLADRKFIQVLVGPRQVGKTTLARQCMELFGARVHYVSADEPTLKGAGWIREEWLKARDLVHLNKPALLIIDEVQKANGWSESIKMLWDEDSFHQLPLHVLMLGSSPLLVQKGLTESLAGRFEVIPVTHWSFTEMKTAFDFSFEQFLYYGGYPGAAALIDDEIRWRQYIQDSLIETTVARDLLLMTRVDKPALLRRLFLLGCEYSGQMLSYQKMLGQLQESANTTTLAHYLDLLGGAGLVCGIQKYAGQRVRRRASSPKLCVYNTALMSALLFQSYDVARSQPDCWGRLTESAVIAYALNAVRATGIQVNYWMDRNREVDLVLSCGDSVHGFEIKSTKKKYSSDGLTALKKAFRNVETSWIGGKDGIPVETFLSTPLNVWL